MYDNSLCTGCAQSTVHSLQVANTREFVADVAVCLGCQVREQHIENNPDLKKHKGVKIYAVNLMGKHDE